MAKSKGVLETIEVEPLLVGSMTVWLKGQTPLICNRMAGKAMRELLFPFGRKGKAVRDQTLKHDPMNEYRNSMSVRSGSGPTRIVFPSPAVKGAMASAALETKGTSRAQIGRLVWVKGYSCDLYGVPMLHMSVVRSADQNKTPDVRTRAILPEWCLQVTIQFVKPQMSETAIAQLLANGGIIIGIGDFRQEKGKGNYGQFCIASEEECESVINEGGLQAQDESIADPECFDDETRELLAWFCDTVKARGKQGLLSSGS